MKKTIVGLMAFLLLIMFSFPLMAQLQVQKVPGEPVLITWTFAQADEAVIDGFKILSASASDGPYTEFRTLPATAREITFPAESTPKFYKVASYKGADQSAPSYPLLVNIRLKGAVGVALQ